MAPMARADTHDLEVEGSEVARGVDLRRIAEDRNPGPVNWKNHFSPENAEWVCVDGYGFGRGYGVSLVIEANILRRDMLMVSTYGRRTEWPLDADGAMPLGGIIETGPRTAGALNLVYLASELLVVIAVG